MKSVRSEAKSCRKSEGTARVLVVDADADMRTALTATLGRAGYTIDAVGTATAARQQSLSTEYELVILDLRLPDGDGQALLRELVSQRPRQVVMVVSRISDTATKVDCLKLGARDYLTKPFSPQELIARMRLRLEPVPADWNAHAPPADGRLSHAITRGGLRKRGPIRMGGLHLDLRQLTADAGHGPVRLTRTEFLLLVRLAEHADRPVPARRLLAEVWGYAIHAQSNVVGVCVRRLRSKLGPRLIETVRGEGYRLVKETREGRDGLPSGPCRKSFGG